MILVGGDRNSGIATRRERARATRRTVVLTYTLYVARVLHDEHAAPVPGIFDQAEGRSYGQRVVSHLLPRPS